MKLLIVAILAIFTITTAQSAHARDIKVVAQEFLPLQGTGPSGKMEGAHYEVVKRACEKLKWNCTFQSAPLARCIEMLKNGDAQISMGLAKNPERMEIANFPNMLSQLGYTFFVKKGSASKYSKPDDMKGMTVGVHGGSATGKDLIEQNKKLGLNLKITDEATAETPAKKLAGNRYGDGGAIYCSRPVCMYQAKKEHLDIEPVSFDVKLQSHSAPIAKKGVTAEELEQYKKAIAEVMKMPEIKTLFEADHLTVHPDNK